MHVRDIRRTDIINRSLRVAQKLPSILAVPGFSIKMFLLCILWDWSGFRMRPLINYWKNMLIIELRYVLHDMNLLNLVYFLIGTCTWIVSSACSEIVIMNVFQLSFNTKYLNLFCIHLSYVRMQMLYKYTCSVDPELFDVCPAMLQRNIIIKS